MVDACERLEQAPASKFPRSVRIQIPRVLIAFYEIRNNRGVGHVGGDVWKVGDVLRILNPAMGAKDKALVLLYHSRVWVNEDTLREAVEYSNPSEFKAILRKAHKQKLIEYDAKQRRAYLSPIGIDYVESKISLHV